MYSHGRRRRRHVRLLAIQLLLPFILVFLLNLPATIAASNCLRFADHQSINQAFIDGGPGHRVLLCPSKTYRLAGTIVFTAADQELSTYGSPTGSERAKIIVAGDFATVIQGDCRRCARVVISNLIINGGRSKLGRMVDTSQAAGLIVLGGNEGQVVRQCSIKYPRGFTAIHIREGDKMSCTGAIVEKNEIGPVGEEYDPVKDGVDPESSPLGRPLADGVSIACRDSFIQDNMFFDNTDAAIVVYCSPGTVIQSNRITSRKLSAMAGILLVDATPFDGDYTGTIVKSNVIDAASNIIRVGIGIGPPVWSDDIDTVLKGGSVLANGLKGPYMGFGIAAAGLDGWTIMDNWDEAKHVGVKSARCFEDSVNPGPVAFLQHSSLIKNSQIQPGFVDQTFEYIVCIDGPNSVMTPTQEVEVQPKAEIAAEPVTPPPVEGFNTGSAMMDDILEHSQQRMMEAIEHLGRRVDILAANSGGSQAMSGMTGAGSITIEVADSLVDLAERVEALEKRQLTLLQTTASMRSALRVWDDEMATANEWQYEVLLDVQHRLNRFLNEPSIATTDKSEDSRTESNRSRLIGRSEGAASWISFKSVAVLGFLGTGVWGIRRWFRRRRHDKEL